MKIFAGRLRADGRRRADAYLPLSETTRPSSSCFSSYFSSSVYRYFLRQCNLHREERNADNLRFANGSVRQQELVTMHSKFRIPSY